MALGRLEIKSGSKGKGQSHSDYIAREGKYEGYDKTEKMEGKGHGNMPSWATNNPQYFWQMADEHERKNGTSYREHIIALPRELNEEQRGELVQDWIKNEVGDKHPYQYAIHNKIGMDEKQQPHLHLMINEREQDGIQRDPDQYFKRYNAKNPDRGGCKKANTGLKSAERKENIKEQRQRWEDTCNKHLEMAGLDERIDMSKGDNGRHIPYEQMKKPNVEKAYREELKIKSEIDNMSLTKEEFSTGYKELQLMELEQSEEIKAPPPPPPKENKSIEIEGQTPHQARLIVQDFTRQGKARGEQIRIEKINELKVKLNAVAKEYNVLNKKSDGIGGGMKKMLGGKSERDKKLDELLANHKFISRDIERIEKTDFKREGSEKVAEENPQAYKEYKKAYDTLRSEVNYKYGTREGRSVTGEVQKTDRLGVIVDDGSGKKHRYELESLDKIPSKGDTVSITYDRVKGKAKVEQVDRVVFEQQQQQADQERQQQHSRGAER